MSGRLAVLLAAVLTLWAAATVGMLATLDASTSLRAPAPPAPTFEEATGSFSPARPFDTPSEAPAGAGADSDAAAPATSEAIQVIGESGPVSVGPRGGPLNTRGADLYDCADFASWEQLLAVFIASGVRDPNRLDPSGSGAPCTAGAGAR